MNARCICGSKQRISVGEGHCPSLQSLYSQQEVFVNKIKLHILVLLFALLTGGCQSGKPSTDDTIPTTEIVQQTEIPSVPDVPETEETQPSVDYYQAYQWMVNLKAEDVAYVEFINLNETQFPYRRYEGDEIQEVIDLFQAKECLEYAPLLEYAPIVQWPGYYSKEFHVVTKDGTAHTVCSVYSTITVIDGTGFHTISDWLNNHWPETGNAPLPDNWAQDVAERNYHTAEDSVSTHSTSSHDIQRQNLDHSYNTDIEFGSASRNYPIGRGGLAELSASGVTGDGLSLSAYWTGTGGLTRLHVQPQYWLEKWQEDSPDGTGSYRSFNGGQFLSEVPQELFSEGPLSWYVSWKDTCGSLEPGHYRVGMICYEEYNGNIQNETICYAKFSITEP